MAFNFTCFAQHFFLHKKEDDSGRKVMNLSMGDNVKSLDPALAYDSVSLTVMPLALESLFQYKYTKVPLELEPLLANGIPHCFQGQKSLHH